MKRFKALLKNKKFYMISSILLVLVFFAVAIISDNFAVKEDIKFTADEGYYQTDEHPITNITDSNGEKPLSISNFYTWDYSGSTETWTVNDPANVTGFNGSDYTGTGENKKYIGIANMEELVAFSRLCNEDKDELYFKSFLKYNYILTDNISSEEVPLYFLPIGAAKENQNSLPFEGAFNGNGYDITGLNLLYIERIGNDDDFHDNYRKTQESIEYFSLFSKNKGSIENVGLINTNISSNYAVTESFYKAALLCGENMAGGLINHVYVRDFRSDANKKSGLLTFGGFTISGFVFSNKGTVTNSYVAYNSVINGSVTDYTDFNELIYENSGTIDNLYFYNKQISSIDSITYTDYQDFTNTTKTITYADGLSLGRFISGTYCPTVATLNAAINSSSNTDRNNWYVASQEDYGDAAEFLSDLMPTPILRGLEFDSTTNTFSIKNEADYALMYEFFNSHSKLAGNQFTYSIEGNINLSVLDYKRYTYKNGIAATITGKPGEYNTNGSVTVADTTQYPVIFYPDLINTFVTVEGFNAYGLFGYVTGTISNLNVVLSKNGYTTEYAFPTNSTNNNMTAFGAVCGYTDSGTIDNVNVYGNISFTGKAKAFIGGAVGVVTGLATVSRTTTAGSINLGVTQFASDQINYIQGEVVGGVIGYITSATGNINSLLNTMNITAAGIANNDLTVGGVLGAGYTNNAGNLQNEGSITISSQNYDKLYVAGVIGRHLGIMSQVKGITNYGDITVNNNISKETYICGTVNATPITGGSSSYLLLNNYKENGRYYYLASRIINGANINFDNPSSYVHHSDIINVITDSCITNLSGLYNLSYNNKSTKNSKISIGDRTIKMSNMHNYSPIINYEYNFSSYDVANLTTAYNLRNFVFNHDKVEGSAGSLITYNYSGITTSNNINFTNVRNEGNFTFDISSYALYANMYVNGITKTISDNSMATTIVNSGNITFNHTQMVYGNLYFAGICYENKNTSLQSSINKFNPNTTEFDSTMVGSLNNVINSGSIEVTNNNYASGITYTAEKISSSNGQQDIGYYHNPSYSGSYISGNINVAGITNINYSVITNTFNIGDIFTANVCKTNGYMMNSAGIADLNIGQYAYILNSANNGEIKSINAYNSSITTSLTTAGIVARNDLKSDLTTYSSDTSNPHSKQVIAFTINYGAIYAYNYNENIVGTNAAPNSISSGIVGMGILNVVNVLNYGNIFGSETISGIFGVVYFGRFKNEVSSSNKIMLANTINYGNTFILYKGYNKHETESTAISKGHYDHNIIEYPMFKTMDLNYSTFTYNNSSKNRNSYANYLVSREVSYKSINGSIFSIINFDNNNNAQYVTIRYLINFEENAPLVGYEPATPTAVSINRSTIYSAYSKLDTRNNGSGQMIRDTYMSFGSTGNYVIYSPLNSDTKKKIKTVTSDSTVDVLNASDVLIETITYNGVFSKEFDFYKAITKTYSQDEIDANPTDAFLGDFFQFVEYSYINDVLVEKIGWKDIAYMAAANEFARSTSSIDKLLTKFSSDSVSYTTYTSAALNSSKTSIWTKWSSNAILTEVIDNLISNNEIENLESMLEYIFSNDSKSNVLITTEIREELFDQVINSSLSNTELKSVLASILTYQNGYSQVLADAILEDDSNVYEFVNDYLVELCENFSDTSIVINLLKDYITILGDETTNYFSYNNNEQVRFNILNTMFEQISDNYFYEILCNLLDITSLTTYDDELKMHQGYETLSNDEKYQLYLKIIENNSDTNINTYLSKMDGEIGYYARLVETGYIASNLTDTYSAIGSGTTTEVDNTTIDERVALWNKIRNSETFRAYLKTRMTDTYYYFLATEHNNTYQSTTAPNNSGAYSGDLSYFYTRSISPSTYFYGPYRSADANGKNGIEFDTKTINYNTYTTYDAMSIKQYHSFFIGDSLNFVDEYVYYNFDTNSYEYYTNQTSGFENEIGTDRIDGVLPASLYMYEFGYTGANNQFSFVPILKSTYYTGSSRTTFDGQTGGGLITDFGGTTLKTTSAYMMNNGNRIDLSNATISYHVVNSRDTGRFQIIDAKGNPYTIQGEFTVYDANIKNGSSAANNLTYLNTDYFEIDTTSHYIKYKNSGDRTWGDFIYRYGRNYYFSEVDYNYHRTRKTGIYEGTGNAKSTYTASGYTDNTAKVIWLTHKQSDARPVITSQYMDYTVDQLLELDGYYTKFDDGTTKCDDERNIINAIFRYYLCNNESTFKTVISKSLMEVLVYDVESSLVYAKWGNNNPYYISSATRGNVSINNEDNTSFNNINTTTNWYNNKTSISGTITSQNAYYYNNGWRQKNINYTVNVTGIKFNKDHSLNTSTISVTSDTVNNISNTSLSYSNGVLTLSFRHYYRQNYNNYYYNITVPINITTYQVINVSDGYKIENSGNIYYIKKDDNTVATITNNYGTVSYSLNTSGYEYKNITFNQSSDVFLSFICSPKNKINYSYIDNFVNANINSDTIIANSKLPFAYLMYDSTQSVKNYLISRAPSQVNNYKEWLISNATNTESKYYGLISKLLDLKVLTPSEMSNSKNATIAGANGVTVSNVNNAVMNTTLVNDYSSTTYGGNTYYSTNSHGFNATSMNLSGVGYSNVGIVAKGSSANANLSISVTHTNGNTINITSNMLKVTANNTSASYSGTVDTSKAYLYIIPQASLNDMVAIGNFEYDVEYYTYSNGTYTSAGILFPTGTNVYVADSSQQYGYRRTSASNFTNATQLYRGLGTNPVNDTSATYYKKTNSAAPSITITMTNNVSVYGVYQGTNNLINYNFTSVNDYLSSIFYGSTSNHVSNDDHRNDLIKMLINLLPIQTSYYIESSDVSNLIVDYQSDSITSVDSLLIQYLSANPVSNYTISNLYKLIVCSSNEVFRQLLSNIKTQITSEITSEYTSEQIATIYGKIKTIHTLLLQKLITNSFGYISIADYIDKYHSLGLSNTDRLITAAYIASDYENQYQQSLASGNNVLLYNSQIRQLLAASNKKYNNVSIQYFNSNGTFDNDKFDALLGYLGLGTSNDVYGIYALASSMGIKNGDFIPDNLNLASMNVGYVHDNTYGYVLLDVDSEGNFVDSANWRIYGEVTATKYGDRYTGDNSTAKSDSVNYAFLIEMKQLKKAIATTLFELDFTTQLSNSKYSMYSSSELITEATKLSGASEKNHYTVTYYVPTAYLNEIVTGKNLKIIELIISTTAEAYVGNTSTKAVINSTTYSGSSFVKCDTLSGNSNYNTLSDSYVYVNALKVQAEDERVYSYYDILLRPIDYSFNMKYQTKDGVTEYESVTDNSATVAAKNGVVSLKINSPFYERNTDTNVMKGSVYYTRSGAGTAQDPYVYTEVEGLVVGDAITGTYYSAFTMAKERTFDSNKTYYTASAGIYTPVNNPSGTIADTYYVATKATKIPKGLDLSPYVSILDATGKKYDQFEFASIAGDHIVNADGSADITINILSSLPKGTYDLVVDLYGTTRKVTLIKEPNDEKELTLVYDGDTVTFNSSSKTDIDYEATTSILWGQPFSQYELQTLAYLDSYTVSPNTTVEITIEYDNSNARQFTNVEYTLAKYLVTIKVTAEDNSHYTYQHILEEKDPFYNGETPIEYATLYKDGIVMPTDGNSYAINSSIRPTTETTTELHLNDNVTKVYFTRDEGEPNYRVKYSFANIYFTDDSSIDEEHKQYWHYGYNEFTSEYEAMSATASALTKEKVEQLYQGFVVAVTTTMDTGNYVYAYNYTNYSYQTSYFELVYVETEVTLDSFDELKDNLYTESSGTYSKIASNAEFDVDATYYVPSYKLTEDEYVVSGKNYYTDMNGTTATGLTVGDRFERFGEERELIFPKIEIIKLPSLNALIDSATFIDEYAALGALSTLINPQTSFVPTDAAQDYDGDEAIYSTSSSTSRKMNVDPTSRQIQYKQGGVDYSTTTNDYYIVGTTSDAELSDYAPTISLQDDYAKFFQFMSPTKRSDYDGENGKDYLILNDHTDSFVYLYVPFEPVDGGDIEVYLVSVALKDMSYMEVYSIGKEGALTLVQDLGTQNGNTKTYKFKGKDLYNITINQNSSNPVVNETSNPALYKVSSSAGDTTNRSLYMNYAQETKNNRFWYVSYVVFSEDFFMHGLGEVPSDSTVWDNRIKFYNIAVIDISNNIRFILEVDAPEGFKSELDSIYVTFAYNKYTNNILVDTNQLSAYVNYTDELYVFNSSTNEYSLVPMKATTDTEAVQGKRYYTSSGAGTDEDPYVYTLVSLTAGAAITGTYYEADINSSTSYYFLDRTTNSYQKVAWDGSGSVYDTFISIYSLQLMPTAYYKFSVDLPSGYVATYTVSKQNTYSENPIAKEAGSYLPPSSLVTQTIKVTIKISEGTTGGGNAWGISTSTVTNVEVTPEA